MKKYRMRQGDRQGDVRDRPGRGRDCGDRHGRRRGLGGRAGDDVDVRPRHLADGRVRRPGVLRRAARRSCSTSSASARRPGCRRAPRRATSSRPRCCRTATPSRSCCIPASVEECYTMAMDAFDLAERFQTLVFVMSDLDLGMNTWMSRTFTYPEKAARSRQGARRGRRWRGWASGAATATSTATAFRIGRSRATACRPYFTRGSGHNEKGQYSERPDDYVKNLDRLARKFETARKHVPKPESSTSRAPTSRIIGYGTSHWAIDREPRSARARGGAQDRVPPPARLSVHRRARAPSSTATSASTSSSRTATRRC